MFVTLRIYFFLLATLLIILGGATFLRLITDLSCPLVTVYCTSLQSIPLRLVVTDIIYTYNLSTQSHQLFSRCRVNSHTAVEILLGGTHLHSNSKSLQNLGRGVTNNV